MTHRINTLQWMCEQKGIAWHTFCSRYYMYGWNLERALNEKTNERKKKFLEIREQIYKDYQNGLSKNELAHKYHYHRNSICIIIKKQKRKEQKHGTT